MKNANDNNDIAETIVETAREWGWSGSARQDDKEAKDDAAADPCEAQDLAKRTGISRTNADMLVERLGSEDRDELDAAAQLTKRSR